MLESDPHSMIPLSVRVSSIMQRNMSVRPHVTGEADEVDCRCLAQVRAVAAPS